MYVYTILISLTQGTIINYNSIIIYDFIYHIYFVRCGHACEITEMIEDSVLQAVH